MLYFPLYAVLKPLLEKLFLHGLTPRVVPTIQIDAEVPQEGKSLMVISTLVEKPEKTAAFEKKMEDLLYCTPKGVDFMVLCDFKEADQPQEAQDKYMASANLKAICRLNARYPGRFFMLIRKRTFCPTQEKYSGWERKRGALTQLIRLMNGDEVPVYALEGVKMPCASTVISSRGFGHPPAYGFTQKLIGAAIHPLNRPVIDMQKNMVTSGYGIIAPRIATSLESARKTWFSRIMPGCGGTSAYDSACGELYQDVFGEGIFAGKGIIDVQAFYKLLDHAFDEGKILSHDILESAFLLLCVFVRLRNGRQLPLQSHRLVQTPSPLDARGCAKPALFGRNHPLKPNRAGKPASVFVPL